MKRTVGARRGNGAGDSLRPEYRFDYRRSRPNRFARQFGESAVVVLLDPDVASLFSSSESVNSLLRSVAKAVRPSRVSRKSSRGRGRANKALQRTARARRR